jgi:hypothetical protein
MKRHWQVDRFAIAREAAKENLCIATLDVPRPSVAHADVLKNLLGPEIIVCNGDPSKAPDQTDREAASGAA